MKAVLWLYRFVVGDPYLLAGGVALLALAWLLHGLIGAWDAAVMLVGVCAVLVLSLVRRPE
ncbi:MAG: hypothetical protein K6V73_03460 [Firmicutes bacterium]|nr:hypothetical protein [Bacillota bacterium]